LFVPIGVPPLLTGLVDDAAIFPPGSATLPEAVAAHRRHHAAWYAPMVGPLLIPAIDAMAIDATASTLWGPFEIGLVGERNPLARALSGMPEGITVRQIESPVAKRGEDPMPGIKAFLALVATVDVSQGIVQGFAEVPLTWGLMTALDHLAEARAAGANVAPKFRTGGLAAELFPTPVELAAVMCACRDRNLPFKLAAGLHRAVRQTDPETGLVHHGFLNVLVAALAASEGGEPIDLAEVLGAIDALPLAEVARANLDRDRPLWIGFGTYSVAEPLADLTTLGLLPRQVT
jgi:hypothetical protein